MADTHKIAEKTPDCPDRPGLAIVFGISVLVKLLVIFLLPVTQDEAYYWVWSRNLAAGYFDHPPMVALWGALGSWFPGTVGVRLGAFVSSILIFLCHIRLLLVCDVKGKCHVLSALVLGQLNLAALLTGILSTPDSFLVLFWYLALTEVILAFKGEKLRWILVGVFSGLALLSKYTGAILGILFLVLLVREKKQIRTPYPWVGLLFAFLVFSPNLLWNAKNHWTTFRFQLAHGLSYTEDLQTVSGLPARLSPRPDSAESILAAKLESQLESLGQKKHVPKPKKTKNVVLEALKGFFEFLGGQAAFLGFFLWIFVSFLFRFKWPKDFSEQILVCATVIPILFFGTISLFSKVEANWAIVYLVGASILVGKHYSGKLRPLIILASLNCLLLLALGLHGKFLYLPLHNDRVKKETSGYLELAHYLGDNEKVLFTQNYQFTSMLRYYLQSDEVYQWPKLSRPSEFTRGSKLGPKFPLSLKNGFMLVSNDKIPPSFVGFRAVDFVQFRNCGGKVGIVHHSEQSQSLGCQKPVHSWYLAEYKPSTTIDSKIK